MTNETRFLRPTGRVRCVLDTDAYNEIDDQFALAYLLKRADKFEVLALTAAPFHNEKSYSPAEGMRLSYEEIKNIQRLIGLEDAPVFEGSPNYLPDEKTAVDSPAARELVRLSQSSSAKDPLYIIAIGAITNVSSALLMEPMMAERCVVVWLGGNARHWPDNQEFNMQQDVAAARVLFDSGVPVVQLPCAGVVSELKSTGPELRHWLAGKNPLCDYLVGHVEDEVAGYAGGTAWSRVIWDVAAIAWFIDEGFMDGSILPSPICGYDHRHTYDSSRHPCLVIERLNRDAIFTDLFRTLGG